MMESACSTNRETIALRECENDDWMIFSRIGSVWYMMGVAGPKSAIFDRLELIEKVHRSDEGWSGDLATEDASFILEALSGARPSL